MIIQLQPRTVETLAPRLVSTPRAQCSVCGSRRDTTFGRSIRLASAGTVLLCKSCAADLDDDWNGLVTKLVREAAAAPLRGGRRL